MTTATMTPDLEWTGRLPSECPLYERHFETEGWTYYTGEDRKDDVVKIEHFIERDGAVKRIPFSPYVAMRLRDVRTWILLEFPRPLGIGPLTASDLTLLRMSRADSILASVRFYLARHCQYGAPFDPHKTLAMIDRLHIRDR